MLLPCRPVFTHPAAPTVVLGTISSAGTPREWHCRFLGGWRPSHQRQLSYPSELAVDTAGNLYIADTYDNAIRKVSRDGVISTVAYGGYDGHGGPSNPTSVAIDSSGNLFIGGGPVVEVSPQGTTRRKNYNWAPGTVILNHRVNQHE